MIFVNFYTGIKSFATNENTVLKWCLNRAEQLKNTTALKEMCGVGMDPGMYKSMRPSRITKLERDVQKTLRFLVEDYINPFGLEVENEYLVCLSSGEPVSDEIVDSILPLPRQGIILLLKSVSNWKPYHFTIPLKSIVFFNRCFNSVF